MKFCNYCNSNLGEDFFTCDCGGHMCNEHKIPILDVCFKCVQDDVIEQLAKMICVYDCEVHASNLFLPNEAKDTLDDICCFDDNMHLDAEMFKGGFCIELSEIYPNIKETEIKLLQDIAIIVNGEG